MNILNLPGWEVTGHTQTKMDYRIEAVYTPEPSACPECPTLFDRLYRHGKREQEIRDLPAHGTTTSSPTGTTGLRTPSPKP